MTMLRLQRISQILIVFSTTFFVTSKKGWKDERDTAT